MAAPKKTTSAKKTVTKKASAAASSTIAVAEPKASAPTTKKSSTGTTKVVAQIDVGFGNSLYIRGNGAGLSWEQGKLMSWSDGAWSWSSPSKQDLEFKVLVNDQTWANGDNCTVKAGQTISFVPQF